MLRRCYNVQRIIPSEAFSPNSRPKYIHSSSLLSSLAMDAAPPPENAPTPEQPKAEAPLTMQLVIRRDLLEAEGWGIGPLLAQSAHAAAAVLHTTRDLENTRLYLDDIPNMRKVVLQVSTDASLFKLQKLLSESNPPIPHYLWIEQPEDVPTCLALAPNRKPSPVKKALDKSGARLWKG